MWSFQLIFTGGMHNQTDITKVVATDDYVRTHHMFSRVLNFLFVMKITTAMLTFYNPFSFWNEIHLEQVKSKWQISWKKFRFVFNWGDRKLVCSNCWPPIVALSLCFSHLVLLTFRQCRSAMPQRSSKAIAITQYSTLTETPSIMWWCTKRHSWNWFQDKMNWVRFDPKILQFLSSSLL